MSQLLFPDNTVLINFALINRMDLLNRIANGRGRWCATVATECAMSSHQPELGELGAASNIFGEPWYPETGAEHLDTRTLRLELAQPGDDSHKHLGEAETLAIMSRRNIDGLFVTDDKEAARLAGRHNVKVVSTWDLVRVAVKCRFIDADAAWGYALTLRDKKRGTPPSGLNRDSFDQWLK